MKVKNRNRGMTMMETLAAFAILMIITASLIGIIQFSSKMSMDAADRRMMAAELNEQLAHKTTDTSMNPGFQLISKEEGQESSMMLVLDTDATSRTNYDPDLPGANTAAIELRGCDVYQLAYPDALNPDIIVLRFEYDPTAY